MKLARRIDSDVSSLGMRRVDWVRITVGGESTTAEAFGVGHRQPCRRTLPLPMAARLTADGVPFVVCHTPTDAESIPGSD